MKISPFVLPALLCSGLACRGAHADMQWTEVMTVDSPQTAGNPGFGISTTKWAKKDAQRTETTMKMGPLNMVSAEITRCDEGQTYQILPDQKIYTAAPLSAVGAFMPAMPQYPGMGGRGGRPAAPEAAGTGTSNINTTLKDLGAEKIIGIDTEHYQLTMTTVSTGCAGNGTQTIQMETWVADIPAPVPCLAPTPEDASKAAAQIGSACDVKTTFSGDVTGMKKVFGGFLMKMKVTSGKGSFTKEVTMLSRADQPDAPFALGADWKKVSDSEFQTAKRNAMIKSMMAGRG